MPGLSSYLVIAVLLLTAALPFVKGKGRAPFENILLLLFTGCLLLFFGQMEHGSSRPKVQSQVSEERAESMLRTMSIINVGTAKLSDSLGWLEDGKGKKHHPLELSDANLDKSFSAAEASLTEAIKDNPEKPELKAKLIVLLSVRGKHSALARSTCQALIASKSTQDQDLGRVLNSVYYGKADNGDDSGGSKTLAQKLKIVEAGIPRGWYQDKLKLALYRTSKDTHDLHQFVETLEDSYYRTFFLSIAALGMGSLCAFIGVVVLVIQLGSFSRRSEDAVLEEEPVGLDTSLRKVYAVFAGWLTSQLAIAEAFKLLPRGLFSLGGSTFGIAVFSLVSYLITMLPALLLIYFIALRPLGLNPIRAFKLRFRTKTMGPFRLILTGILSWCAIIPLVLIGSLLASALGSQGSDNPVLPQIASIASSQNILAIVILFFTVACLAPFCEEIIFRGFLYAALKVRFGIFPAVLVSSLIFAGIHFDKGGALMLCALGPVLAIAFERSRSLLPSMIAHGLWNGIAFAVTLALYFS